MKSTIATLIDEEILNSHFLLESDAEFMQRICNHIFQEMSYLRKLAPSAHSQEIFEEIEDQVLEVFKIKTYGYLNLQHYRKVHGTKMTRIG